MLTFLSKTRPIALTLLLRLLQPLSILAVAEEVEEVVVEAVLVAAAE
jgi:hypothetical protein